MKQFILFLFFVTSFVALSAQPLRSYVSNTEIANVSDTEIANTILRSTRLNGLQNPNLIYPGQSLEYILPNGQKVNWFVSPGDCQWGIVMNILDDGPNYEPSLPLPVIPEVTKENQKSFFDFIVSLPWWVWLLLFFVIIGLIVSIIEKRQNANPLTAGTPQVPGGVDDERAQERLRQIVANRYPGARLVIRNIRRSNLTGRFRVMYASAPRWWKFLHGDKPYSRLINVNGVAGYAGEVTINGREETIYFLQGCGNDTAESYMVSEANSVIINPDGTERSVDSNFTTEVSSEVIAKQEAQAPIIEKGEKVSEVIESASSEAEKFPVEVSGTESFRIQMKLAQIVQQECSSKEVHSFTAEITPEGGFKVDVKYKDAQKQKN